MKRLAALLALGLVLSACTAGDDSAAFEEFYAGDDAQLLRADSGDGESLSAPANLDIKLDVVEDRKVIRRANLQLHDSDTRTTFDEIIRLTESVGGFVSSATVFPAALALLSWC